MNKNNKTSQAEKYDTAVLAALRRRIDVLERGVTEAPERPSRPFGVPEIDAVLPGGGLPSRALHEITGDGNRNEVIAFCAALLTGMNTDAGENTGATVLWCRGGDDLYAPGLGGFGLDLGRLLLVRVQRDRDLLWVMEEGLRSGALAAVVAEPSKVTTTALRRLQLAAEAGGSMGFILRHHKDEVVAGPIATRWRVGPALSRPLRVGTALLPGQPRWQLELIRCRNGRSGTWTVEWQGMLEDESAEGRAAGGFALVSEVRHGPHPAVAHGARPANDALSFSEQRAAL